MITFRMAESFRKEFTTASHLYRFSLYYERNQPVKSAICGLCAGASRHHTTKNGDFRAGIALSISCEIFGVAIP